MEKTIYLAGGCFWGTEKYLSLIPGVVNTEVGYANGKTENPTYEEVCHDNTGHAETVKVTYDAEYLSLRELLTRFFRVIDPTSVNRQGNDTGVQYRTGIYYTQPDDKTEISSALHDLQTQYEKPLAVEEKILENFYPAEEYHQKYLDKNPGGYCHIPVRAFEMAKEPVSGQTEPGPGEQTQEVGAKSPAKEELKQRLTAMQYKVTQENGTEPPFQNEYYNEFREGIYVDIVTGEPLFVSSDKFESGCGWPSFSKPIDKKLVKELADTSLGRYRTEVRSTGSGSHLGHVFEDGPVDLGGLRYCINSAALRFVPKEKMEEEGYGEYLPLV